jgi:hypothetical protein
MAAASPPLLGMLQAGALGTAVAVLATLADDMAKAGGPATDALDRALTMLESACQWDDWEDLTQLSTRPNGLLLQMALVQLSCLLPEDTLRTRARTAAPALPKVLREFLYSSDGVMGDPLWQTRVVRVVSILRAAAALGAARGDADAEEVHVTPQLPVVDLVPVVWHLQSACKAADAGHHVAEFDAAVQALMDWLQAVDMLSAQAPAFLTRCLSSQCLFKEVPVEQHLVREFGSAPQPFEVLVRPVWASFPTRLIEHVATFLRAGQLRWTDRVVASILAVFAGVIHAQGSPALKHYFDVCDLLVVRDLGKDVANYALEHVQSKEHGDGRLLWPSLSPVVTLVLDTWAGQYPTVTENMNGADDLFSYAKINVQSASIFQKLCGDAAKCGADAQNPTLWRRRMLWAFRFMCKGCEFYDCTGGLEQQCVVQGFNLMAAHDWLFGKQADAASFATVHVVIKKLLPRGPLYWSQLDMFLTRTVQAVPMCILATVLLQTVQTVDVWTKKLKTACSRIVDILLPELGRYVDADCALCYLVLTVTRKPSKMERILEAVVPLASSWLPMSASGIVTVSCPSSREALALMALVWDAKKRDELPDVLNFVEYDMTCVLDTCRICTVGGEHSFRAPVLSRHLSWIVSKEIDPTPTAPSRPMLTWCTQVKMEAWRRLHSRSRIFNTFPNVVSKLHLEIDRHGKQDSLAVSLTTLVTACVRLVGTTVLSGGFIITNSPGLQFAAVRCP